MIKNLGTFLMHPCIDRARPDLIHIPTQTLLDVLDECSRRLKEAELPDPEFRHVVEHRLEVREAFKRWVMAQQQPSVLVAFFPVLSDEEASDVMCRGADPDGPAPLPELAS